MCVHVCNSYDRRGLSVGPVWMQSLTFSVRDCTYVYVCTGRVLALCGEASVVISSSRNFLLVSRSLLGKNKGFQLDMYTILTRQVNND